MDAPSLCVLCGGWACQNAASLDGRWAYDVFFVTDGHGWQGDPLEVSEGRAGSPTCFIGPYQVEPIDTASQGPVAAGDCPTNQYPGYVRYVTNQVQLIDGSPYAHAGLTVADIINTGTPDDLGSGTSTRSAQTTGDGSFSDQYSVCSSACPGSNGETVATQQWTLSGIGLPHVDGLIFKCTAITIDGN
jgi:hypothetical protein